MVEVYIRKGFDQPKSKNTLIEEYLLYRPGTDIIETEAFSNEKISKINQSRTELGFEERTIEIVSDYTILLKELGKPSHNLFRITSAFLKGFSNLQNTKYIPSSNEIKESLLKSEHLLSFIAPIGYNYFPFIKKPTLNDGFRRGFLDQINEYTFIWFEVLLLDWCIKQWLIPRKINNKILSSKKAFAQNGDIFLFDINSSSLIQNSLLHLVFEDIIFAHTMSKKLFSYRLNEISSSFWIFEDKKFEPIGKKMTASHLVHGAWFEIVTALEFDLHVGICSECGGVFLQNKMKSKLICGERECIKNYRHQNIFINENMNRRGKQLPLYETKDDAVKDYQRTRKALSRDLKECIAGRISKDFLSKKHDLSLQQVEQLIFVKTKRSRRRS